MSSSKIRLAFGIIWIISGITKFIQLIVGVLIDKEIASFTFQAFAKLCIVPFYTDIIVTYFIPMAILFIFLAGLFEIIAGSLILQAGSRVKLGLVIGIAINLAYAPLAGIGTIIINILFIIPQAWLLTQEVSQNLFQCRK